MDSKKQSRRDVNYIFENPNSSEEFEKFLKEIIVEKIKNTYKTLTQN